MTDVNDIKEFKIPPGIPLSIIQRLCESCGVGYDVRKDELFDKEYPVIYGSPENIENAKKYLILFTECRLSLRDIARLLRKHNIDKIYLYTDDEDLKYALSVSLKDVLFNDRMEIVDGKDILENKNYEKIEICGKPLYIIIE